MALVPDCPYYALNATPTMRCFQAKALKLRRWRFELDTGVTLEEAAGVRVGITVKMRLVLW